MLLLTYLLIRLIDYNRLFVSIKLVKAELENPVHIELNNMIIEPDTGDSSYY